MQPGTRPAGQQTASPFRHAHCAYRGDLPPPEAARHAPGLACPVPWRALAAAVNWS